jgi:hypothetical protein
MLRSCSPSRARPPPPPPPTVRSVALGASYVHGMWLYGPGLVLAIEKIPKLFS